MRRTAAGFAPISGLTSELTPKPAGANYVQCFKKVRCLVFPYALLTLWSKVGYRQLAR